MALIHASGLDVAFGDKAILHGLDFEIENGQWTALLGPNGSGKTTLLRAISGLIPFSGTLKLDGKDISAWSHRALARRVAFVRQTHTISFDFRVMDLVLLGRSPHKSMLSVYNHSDEQLASEALQRLDLTGFEQRSFHSLSGGEQQRVFLAQALVQEADLLILDEPTTFLDVHHQFEFLEHVRTMVEAGTTVIGAIHDLELAARFADRVMVLDRGHLKDSGAPAEVLTAELLASVFRMEARVESHADRFVRIDYARPL